jgi:hypothetical protein
MYSGAGLGLLELTATGVRSMQIPSCVTQGELDEAAAKCPVQQIRGLGVAHGQRPLEPMSGRLAAFSACAIADLPVCPAPKCLDPYTAGLITSCIAGVKANPDFDCTSLTAYMLSQLPYCGGANALGPVPACLTPDLVALRSYCRANPKLNGPNKAYNAGCWAAMRDPSYWAKVLAAPECPRAPVMRDAPIRPPAVTPTTYTSSPAPPVYYEDPTRNEPPADDGDSGGPREGTPGEASMTGVWGILALLAAAGGGYYLYRRYKR